MCSRDHLSYGITQCYLPPGRGDSPDCMLAFTSTHFTIPTEGGRLSRPRHYSKGAQPMPKAVYGSGCRDKQGCGGLHSWDLTHRSRASYH